MNYQAFTNASLTMMYEGIRGALASDDALTAQGEETRFRIREMLKRGIFFDVIDWSEDQGALPFEE